MLIQDVLVDETPGAGPSTGTVHGDLCINIIDLFEQGDQLASGFTERLMYLFSLFLSNNHTGRGLYWKVSLSFAIIAGTLQLG